MPAQFRFPLQPLLDWRERVENKKARALALSRDEMDGSQRELAGLIAARDRCIDALAPAALRSAVGDLRVRDDFLRSLDVAMAEEGRRHAVYAAAWEAARDAFLGARRERRILERLKERRRRLFEAEAARREELELDEANARTYERARRERLAADAAGSAMP